MTVPEVFNHQDAPLTLNIHEEKMIQDDLPGVHINPRGGVGLAFEQGPAGSGGDVRA